MRPRRRTAYGTPSRALRSRLGSRPEVTSENHARVQDALGVEGLLDPARQVQDVRADLIDQPRPLEPTDPVLAGDRAVQLDGQVHDLAEGELGAGRGGGV